MWLHKKTQAVRMLGIGSLGSVTNQSLIEFLTEIQRLPILAHHPACKYYHNHLVWLGNIPLCLGCSMMACGILAGVLLLQIPLLSAYPFYYLLILGVLLYIPAVLQIWIQIKSYKLLARFSLGIAVAFLFYAGCWLTPWSWIGLILRVGFLVIFGLVWNITLKLRSQESKSPCNRCPEGQFPICAYTKTRIQRQAIKYFAKSNGSDPATDNVIRAFQSLSNFHTF
jgi:hypothetical protein